MFVLDYHGLAKLDSRYPQPKPYALFDPANGLVYKLDIERNVMRVFDTNFVDPVSNANGRARTNPNYVRVGTLSRRKITGAAITCVRNAARKGRHKIAGAAIAGARSAAEVERRRRPSET